MLGHPFLSEHDCTARAKLMQWAPSTFL